MLPARFAKPLASLAAITDQSDLWYTLTLTGPNATMALARLVPINLAPTAFPVGALALTRAGHLDVRLWHVGDDTYEVSTARSYASDLEHAFQSMFFSEEKNQKTFTSPPADGYRPWPDNDLQAQT
jgi:heterotetrameric sarcosine oxidase gamma subunit